MLLFSFLGDCMNFCSGWKSATVFSLVARVFTEPHFLGWPAGGSHTHCTVQYKIQHLCWGGEVSTPDFTIPVCQVWCDVTKQQIVFGHFTLVLERVKHCVSVCIFALSMWCWCFFLSLWQKISWSDSQHWCDLHFLCDSVSIRSLCYARQLC